MSTTESPFAFTEPFGDARVAELRLLSWADQQGHLKISPVPEGPWRDLLDAVISNEFVTTFSYERAQKYFGSLGTARRQI